MSKVEVAPSDSRGGPLGPTWSGKARLFQEQESAEADRADAVLGQRYGWKRKVVNLIIRLAGKGGQQIYFAIEDLRVAKPTLGPPAGLAARPAVPPEGGTT